MLFFLTVLIFTLSLHKINTMSGNRNIIIHFRGVKSYMHYTSRLLDVKVIRDNACCVQSNVLIMNLKVRLALMNFLEFAVWGAYLTSMGRYLGNIGMSTDIGWFYSMQGIVSIFMPALLGIIADRWIPAQRLLGFCHLTAGIFMMLAAIYGMAENGDSKFPVLFTLYSLSVAFYMPTLALSNSVAYNALTKAGMDTVKDFPPIRVFGTVGFIITMWFVDIMGFQANQNQFIVSACAQCCIIHVYIFAAGMSHYQRR